MIDFGQLDEPPASSAGGPRRGRTAVLVAAVLVVVVLVALVNAHRNKTSNDRRAAAAASAANGPSGGRTASPNPSSPDSGGTFVPAPVAPVVSCPTIRDEQSRLGYTCIDNYLVQGDAGALLGLRISLDHEVESGWVISEGSGNPLSVPQPPDSTVIGYRHPAGRSSGDSPVSLTQWQAPGAPGATTTAPPAPTARDLQAEVQARTELALQRGYGDNPQSRVLGGHLRRFGAVTGYELLTEVTVNAAYRKTRGLHVKTERLWVIGLPTSAGVSIFMLSIPDQRADLWPKAEAGMAGLHVL